MLQNRDDAVYVTTLYVYLYTFPSTIEYILPSNSIVFSRSFAIEVTSLANARNIRIEVYPSTVRFEFG